jgi:hypothetical protein
MFKRVHNTSHSAASKASEAASSKSQILARRLARPLSAEEIECVAGGLRGSGGHTVDAGSGCTPDIGD